MISVALASVLSGCGQQPIGSFERAQLISGAAQAHHDVRFTPGCTRLAPGEATRLAAFIREIGLRRGDDIVVRMGSTGSDRRDRERRQSLRRAISPGPARLQLTAQTGFSRQDPRHNVALVQVIRHDRLRVDCKQGGYSKSDLAFRMPFPVLNCANPSTSLSWPLTHAISPVRVTLGPARGEPAAVPCAASARARLSPPRSIPLEVTDRMTKVAELVSPAMVFDDDADREPFAAYLADDETLAMTQKVAANRGWQNASIRKGGLNTALRMIGLTALPKFLVVDISEVDIAEAEAGILEIARLGAAVIALGTVNDVQFYRRILRTGARDYLVKPVDAETLGEVFVRLEQSSEGAKPAGRVIGVLGARGGVGTSTVALNIAWIMAEKFSRRTALVDMDVHSGSLALSLDLDPMPGLRAVFEDPDRVDHVFLQNAMTRMTKSLHVLAAEEDYDEPVQITDDKMLRLAETMRDNFDMCVLDMPRFFLQREAALFSRFDDLVIVAELSLSALRDANRIAKIATFSAIMKSGSISSPTGSPQSPRSARVNSRAGSSGPCGRHSRPTRRR